VEGYSRALRGELATSGVDVVVVEPGPFTTALYPGAVNPEDTDGRGATYPQVAHQTFEDIGKAFEELFEAPDAPTDPGLVVARIVELMDMDAGTRPLRSLVGVDFNVSAINEAMEPHEAAVDETIGLTAFMTLQTGK